MVSLPRVTRPRPPPAEPAAPRRSTDLGGPLPVVALVVVAPAAGIPSQLVLVLALLAAGGRAGTATVDAGTVHQNGRSVEPPGLEPGSAGCTSALTCVDT